MPQMGQMPSGAPSQMGLGALAMRQGPQMDPRMMEMMRRLQGGVPQPAQQTGGMMPPGMAAPGGAQISAMNFTPRPATMGLDGMPIQRANDPQMLAQMQAMQQQGGQGSMPPAGVDPRMAAMQAAQMQREQGGMPGGIPVQRPMPFDPRRLPVGAGGKGTAAPGTRPQVSPRPQMDPRMMRMFGGR